MQKLTVIYTRYSSDMQREDSCEDQKREVLDALRKQGIEVADHFVIEDKAESGTKSNRAGFERLTAMISRAEVGILAVDDQSRLSRSDNASSFVKDLVYSGGRFISTGEGIDTNSDGWQLRVKIMEVHNSSTILDIGRRVQRGQKGRVLDDGAAGDHPFGFDTYYLDPNWAETSRRGPKPKKGVQIFEQEARWVRQIFDWFVDQRMSISEIARELTRLNVDKGRKSTTKGWHHSQVRRMLGNSKYIGGWRWGMTATLRNSQGKTKQVPVPLAEQVVRDRPQLRIIDQDKWDKAEERLRELNDVYGIKPDQRPRGPKIHHTDLYQTSLIGGLIFCSTCGSRLWLRGSPRRFYLACPNYSTGLCKMSTTLPRQKAEEVLLQFVGEVVTSWPRWMETTIESVRKSVQEAASRLPESIQRDEARLAKLEREVENLVDSLAQDRRESYAIRSRLHQKEGEVEILKKQITKEKQTQHATLGIPDDDWIKRQFADLASLLKDDTRQAAGLLRRLLHRVTAEAVIAPGKLRGFIRLRVEVVASSLLKETLGRSLPDSIWQTATSESEQGPIEFLLDVRGPTRPDRLAPQIGAMRSDGLTWCEIGRKLGLSTGNCYTVGKRWMRAQRKDIR